jgi:hypothetical protein
VEPFFLNISIIKTIRMKALDLMKTAPSVEDRADNFITSITRNLKKQIMDPLVDRKDLMEDKIKSLMDFSLATDLNKGVAPITREEAEDRFRQVLALEYSLKLLALETAVKTVIFTEYFGEDNVKL